MNKKMYLFSLVSWLSGLVAILAISFLLRGLGSNSGLGFPEVVWFTLQALLFCFSMVLAYKSVAKTRVGLRLLWMLLMAIACGVSYFVLTWWYVVETGVDSI
jgi:glucan phosphoethanolaminetransferase (alkaline phosphatase superfamily)